MDSLNFLEDCPKGNATLSVLYKGNELTHINNLSLQAFEDACPLLALAFEDTRSGPRYYIEDVTPTALACLLRYVHSDPREYVPEDLKQVTTSILLHVQVYRLATIYDVSGLQSLAKANITRGCEFSCSIQQTPPDLCEAIDFIYQHLPKHRDIIDTLANYCVSMFLYHGLGEIQAFRDMAYEHRRFQQDLCMVNINRGFVDDAALAIIQLPIKPFGKSENDSIESMILKDVLYDMWSITGTDCQFVISNKHGHLLPPSSPETQRRDFAVLSGVPLGTPGPAPIPYRQRNQPPQTSIEIPSQQPVAKDVLTEEVSIRNLFPSPTIPEVQQEQQMDEEDILDSAFLRDAIARILLTPRPTRHSSPTTASSLGRRTSSALHLSEAQQTSLNLHYGVQTEKDLKSFVVVEGLPKVRTSHRPALVRFIMAKLRKVGMTSEGLIFMPFNRNTELSEGHVFVKYETPAQASACVEQLEGVVLDVKHTIAVKRITGVPCFKEYQWIGGEGHLTQKIPLDKKRKLRVTNGLPGEKHDQMGAVHASREKPLVNTKHNSATDKLADLLYPGQHDRTDDERYPPQKPLVIRGEKTAGLRYEPYAVQSKLVKEASASLALAEEPLVDYPLSDELADDDGFVHVKHDSDSEWVDVST